MEARTPSYLFLQVHLIDHITPSRAAQGLISN
jgi:hypothetical protein